MDITVDGIEIGRDVSMILVKHGEGNRIWFSDVNENPTQKVQTKQMTGTRNAVTTVCNRVYRQIKGRR